MAAQGLEVIVLVNCLVQDAIRLGASDLHIEPGKMPLQFAPASTACSPKWPSFPSTCWTRFRCVSRSWPTWSPTRPAHPRTARRSAAPEIDNVQLRVSIFPTVRGEKIVVRLFDPRDRRFDLDTLGFDERPTKGWCACWSAPAGCSSSPAHGLGQDQLHVFVPLPHHSTGWLQRQHQHGGGPGRVQPPDGQPDANQSGPGVHLCRGAAQHHAPGPASDHGRRDSRPGNRRHRRAGGADGPPGHQHHPCGRFGGRFHAPHQHGD